MEFIPTPLPGCWILKPKVVADERGRFVKTYVEKALASHGLATHFPEEFYSVSRKGVVRGLHFQRPPHEHAKLVYCSAGRVLDVVVDLRSGSPTYGKAHGVELSASEATMLYVPIGFAHGFFALEDATMHYKVTSVHAPTHDDGILWTSINFKWPVRDAIVSARDRCLAPLDELKSIFSWTAPS
ncbi:dTDP-4-dehydrorhamnose 3,5-epimerase [Deinococcus yavapaiensis]|uniref:dTDP-4-dehydrorhamnose 3,5-epimerase n=1 Tax=Deinococcus yavapaiensis KR-236 TaxID=694435 RepID=A0A318SBE8_9DEIO|nr:dTDP-4-dehydrorhamnose 3,5-epimerase [Deinococcus yavapaiensis]PYE55902.1 dTDP-4-dehydrorhamnose 3,5-epimerase [Deinococcus yavapaiensis KR-236]